VASFQISSLYTIGIGSSPNPKTQTTPPPLMLCTHALTGFTLPEFQ
jgi:hypothetical protein